ncbi:MAG: hypothetical protein U0U69_02180 [Acidimicrobiia bacterium]
MNFVVDYKGGAAFKTTALPHTVGFVTDLDQHLTLVSLKRGAAPASACSHTTAQGRRHDGAHAPSGGAAEDLIVVDEDSRPW